MINCNIDGKEPFTFGNDGVEFEETEKRDNVALDGVCSMSNLAAETTIPEIFSSNLSTMAIIFTFCDNILQGVNDYKGIEWYNKHNDRINNLMDYIMDVKYCKGADETAARVWYKNHIEQGILLYKGNNCWFEYDVLRKFGADLTTRYLYDRVISGTDGIVAYLYDTMSDVLIYQLEQSCKQINLSANLVRAYVYILVTAVDTAFMSCVDNFVQNCNTITQLLCTETNTFSQVMCWLGLCDLITPNNRLINDYLNFDDIDDEDYEDYEYDMPDDYDAGVSNEYETNDLVDKVNIDSIVKSYDVLNQDVDSSEFDWD